MAWDDERDFGMAGGRAPGPNGGGHPGIGMEDIDADVVAAIAAELESAADAGGVPNAIAVNQQGQELTNAQVQSIINLQGSGESTPSPYVSQNYNDFGTAGINLGGQRAVSRGLNYADAMAIESRRQELSDELNRLNAISVQASNATDPYPSSWTSPDEWGMQDVRAAGMGPSPADAQARLGDPVTPLGADVTRSVFPSPLTSVADYPAGDEFGMQDVRVNPLNPSPLTSVADYPGGDDWGMPNVGLTQASIAEGVMGAPGTYSEYSGDRARDASLAFDEYEVPSRQQAEILSRPDEWGMPDYTPGSIAGQGRLDREGTGYYDISRPGGGTDREGGAFVESDLETEKMAWSIANDPKIDDYIEGKITAKELSGLTDVNKLENRLKDSVVEKSKRLTKEEKKDNVAARRKAEEDYVAYRDTLNFQVEMLRSRLATAINTHGKNSKEAKNVKRDVRNKEADLRMWERSDLYNKSYGMVNRPGLSRLGPLKVLAGIEDYFHSLGKTERRDAKDVLQDMKDNPEEYEKVGAEVSAAQLVRNMYPFLRKAPMDVAAAAAKEPAYLRYLINLNVNKKPIPTSYSSNWKNDISDAWIYG